MPSRVKMNKKVDRKPNFSIIQQKAKQYISLDIFDSLVLTSLPPSLCNFACLFTRLSIFLSILSSVFMYNFPSYGEYSESFVFEFIFSHFTAGPQQHFIFIFVCVSVHLSICQSANLSFYTFVSLYIILSICPSVHLSNCPLVYLFIRLSVTFSNFPSVPMSVSPSLCPISSPTSLYPFAHLFIQGILTEGEGTVQLTSLH